MLVVMPAEAAVFADGAAITRLAALYPGGWWGGDLPHAGFWGAALPEDQDKHIRALIEQLR